MTKERYFDMMEQLGKDPIESEIPPQWEDLPQIAIDACDIYGRLGDRIQSDIGYIGKDYTLFDTYSKLYFCDNKELLLEIVLWLDQRSISKSADNMRREREKLKRKSSGK